MLLILPPSYAVVHSIVVVVVVVVLRASHVDAGQYVLRLDRLVDRAVLALLFQLTDNSKKAPVTLRGEGCRI